MYSRRSACYLSTCYIAATLELITPRFSGRATPISIAEKNRYTYHCTAKSLPGFTTAELYLLSVALVLPSRVTDVIRFAALWCPDFPTSRKREINRPIFSRLQRYIKFMGKRMNCQLTHPFISLPFFTHLLFTIIIFPQLPHYYYLRAIIHLWIPEKKNLRSSSKIIRD